MEKTDRFGECSPRSNEGIFKAVSRGRPVLSLSSYEIHGGVSGLGGV